MTDMERNVFHKEYMPYIIKWGKLTCWLSIPLIFIPAIALYIFYQAVPSVGGVITGFIAHVLLGGSPGMWWTPSHSIPFCTSPACI